MKDKLNTMHPSRRDFLSVLGGVGVYGALPLGLGSGLESAFASEGAGGYKAVVCIFLDGGADHASMLIPEDPGSFSTYARIRGEVSLGPASALIPLSFVNSAGQGQSFLVHPNASGLKNIMDRGRLSAVANIGPLFQPTALREYVLKTVPVPEKLYSHNDQQAMWQSGFTEGSNLGFGGRNADAFLGLNAKSQYSAISLAGRTIYLTGERALQLQVGPAGATSLNTDGLNVFGSRSVPEVLRSILSEPSSALFENEVQIVNARSLAINTDLKASLSSASLTTVFPATSLGGQLQMISKIIAARANLQVGRQIFFVRSGGWDMHDNLLRDWPSKIGEVAGAMDAFDLALMEMGLQNSVLSFTASDFGRSLVSNGDGSDHGWGGHQFIMGPRGGRLYGTYPDMGLRTNWDVGAGALLPTSSTEQLGFAVGRFLGVPSATLHSIFSHAKNFSEWIL